MGITAVSSQSDSDLTLASFDPVGSLQGQADQFVSGVVSGLSFSGFGSEDSFVRRLGVFSGYILDAAAIFGMARWGARSLIAEPHYAWLPVSSGTGRAAADSKLLISGNWFRRGDRSGQKLPDKYDPDMIAAALGRNSHVVLEKSGPDYVVTGIETKKKGKFQARTVSVTHPHLCKILKAIGIVHPVNFLKHILFGAVKE